MPPLRGNDDVWPNPSLASGVPNRFQPGVPFAMPPSLPATGVSWSDRISKAVPAPMALADFDANLKVQSLRRYATQASPVLWAHVKSDEFFDVAHYPEIRFVSESFPLQRLRRGGQLSGTLTVRGVEQPETFKLEAADCEHPAYDCPIIVSGSIRRSAFGMHSRRGALSDKVDLHFEVYAIPSTGRLNP